MKSHSYARFLLVGALFTLAGPSLFLLASKFMVAWLASLLAEVTMHTFRCILYNRFVFSSLGAGGIRTYLTAAVPTSLLNVLLVVICQAKLPTWQIAILIAIQSSTIGYLWSRGCYAFNLSSRARMRSR
jgi:putative flippase GtrA